jgi:putative SOS response-associated peptidase YedK
MDGFYEWKAPGEDAAVDAKGRPRKTPMFIHRVDGSPLAAAGLWAAWKDPSAPPEAPWLHTCTVITTSANDLMSQVHDRMPVFLEREHWDLWLDRSVTDPSMLLNLLRPAGEGLLTMHAVSTEVNNVRNKGAELIRPVGP